ncbi:MAG: HNH endonuclease [Lachnospiraceae bacterium]|nr:HNH endonuclease [Lachnospiraceae bacterium]
MYGHKYTDEEKTFMEAYVPGHSYKEIQKAFTDRFRWGITVGQIKSYIGSNNLNTGRTGRFEKGHIPSNKGKKMSAELYEKAKPTMFKKGHVPSNYRPVGSERITKDGYIEIKIADSRKWALKHRVIWESENGNIPKDCNIVFRDGNRKNTNIDNLMMVKKGVIAVLNHTGMCKHKEARETAIRLSELKIETAKAKRRKKEE